MISRLFSAALSTALVLTALPHAIHAKSYIAYISDSSSSSVVYWIAKEAGIFKKHGLDLDTIFIDGVAAFLANGLWWAVVLGALIQTIYMSWLYYDAVKRGRKAKGGDSSFDQAWSEEADETPTQGQFAQYQSDTFEAVA